jgi:hypothetical protein
VIRFSLGAVSTRTLDNLVNLLGLTTKEKYSLIYGEKIIHDCTKSFVYVMNISKTECFKWLQNQVDLEDLERKNIKEISKKTIKNIILWHSRMVYILSRLLISKSNSSSSLNIRKRKLTISLKNSRIFWSWQNR